MATDKADETAGKPGGSNKPEGSSGTAAAGTKPEASRPPPQKPVSDDRSEWTASDSRGPLERADEDDKRREADQFKPAANDKPILDARPTPGSKPPTGTKLETKPAGPSDAPAPLPAAKTGGTGAGAQAGPAAASREPAKRSLLPVAAALVIGALIGAGSAAIVYTNHGGASDGPDVAALSSRVDALEKRPSADAAVAKLEGNVSDLARQVAALGKSGGTAGATPDFGPIEQKIAALQASVDALKSQGGDTKNLQSRLAALEGDVAGAKRESSAAQAGMAGVEDRQKLLANKVMVPALAVVADSLVQQIDQGQPFAAQVDALTALGADPAKIAVLRQTADKGVPSAKMLAAAFEPLAEPIAATAHKAPANAGFVDRLKSGMFSMVSVRNADDTSGTDLPSRVAHIKAALAHDDVVDAIATWNLLPADAKAKGEAWAALAKTSADAMAAARALQHDAIVALAARKS